MPPESSTPPEPEGRPDSDPGAADAPVAPPDPPADATTIAREDIARRVDHIEAGYELMLAYAAQGLPSDRGAATGEQLREYLRRFDEALTGLADRFRTLILLEGREPAAAYDGFLDVLARDASAAQAGLRVVMAQPSISSQLVDNLNASIHVRALLTDMFVIDEALRA